MSARQQKKARILIIEDDEGVRHLEAATLKLAGYDVAEAIDGEDGLSQLRGRRTFDLVILDIMMPRVDGYEVLRQLRAMPNRSHVPVIVVTAKGRDPIGMLQEAAGGADDHLDKPFTPSSLEKAVETVLLRDRGDLEKTRSAQSRAAGVYEAVLHLQASAGGEDDMVRVGRLRRSKR